MWWFGQRIPSKFPSVSKSISVLVKHRKNCKCCPVSLLIVRSQWYTWIQVHNCLKCKQFTQVHTPSHVSVRVHLFVFDFVFFIVWVIVFWLVRSCLLINLIRYLKSHKSLGSLFEYVLLMSLSLYCIYLWHCIFLWSGHIPSSLWSYVSKVTTL